MFDESFERSKVYFTILETLRVSGEWVRNFIRAWDVLERRWEVEVKPYSLFSEDEMRAMDKNWATVNNNIRSRVEVLITHMSSKAEEVKSLRDGVGIPCSWPVSCSN